jgi:hypothetical protein
MSPVSRTEGAISTLIERINNRGTKLFSQEGIVADQDAVSK